MTLHVYPDSHLLCFVKLVCDVENLLKLYAQFYLVVFSRSIWLILCLPLVRLIIFTAIWLSWPKKKGKCHVLWCKIQRWFCFYQLAHHSCNIWIFCLLQHHGQQQLHLGIKTVEGDLTGGNLLNTFLPSSILYYEIQYLQWTNHPTVLGQLVYFVCEPCHSNNFSDKFGFELLYRIISVCSSPQNSYFRISNNFYHLFNHKIVQLLFLF